MRTKILLTAALGVVGAAATYAQVYSVNTVGYVNVTLTAGKFNLISNPLDNKSGNTVGNLFGTTLPGGTAIYKFKNGAYEPTNAYDPDFGGWGNATQTLVPGEGAFIYLEGAVNKTVTFVGDVMQGHLVVQLAKGFNMVSSMVPQAGKLQADLGYIPEANDTVFQFRPTGYLPSNAYDPDFGGWGGGDPQIGVAESFWIQKAQTSVPNPWVRDFTVQ